MRNFKKLEKDFLKKQKEFAEAKAKLLEFYENQTEEMIEGSFLKIFKSKQYVRNSVDTKLLKEKYSKVYNKVVKSIIVKESIKIKRR
jgi:epoxyqueuosine reductase QueG